MSLKPSTPSARSRHSPVTFSLSTSASRLSTSASQLSTEEKPFALEPLLLGLAGTSPLAGWFIKRGLGELRRRYFLKQEHRVIFYFIGWFWFKVCQNEYASSFIKISILYQLISIGRCNRVSSFLTLSNNNLTSNSSADWTRGRILGELKKYYHLPLEHRLSTFPLDLGLIPSLSSGCL